MGQFATRGGHMGGLQLHQVAVPIVLTLRIRFIRGMVYNEGYMEVVILVGIDV